MFCVFDERHYDYHGQFGTFDDALNAIRSYCDRPWDAPPNRAPCRRWKTCGRKYHIHEFKDDAPNARVSDVNVCEICAQGVTWFCR